MAFFDKVSEAGNKIAEGARNMSQVGQIDSEIKTLQKKMESDYLQLGKMLYNEKKGLIDVAPSYDPLVEEISHMQERMQQLTDERNWIRRVTICPECQYEVPLGSLYCPNCGHKMEVVGNVCPSCGTVNDPNARFCATCGTKLKEGENGNDR